MRAGQKRAPSENYKTDLGVFQQIWSSFSSRRPGKPPAARHLTPPSSESTSGSDNKLLFGGMAKIIQMGNRENDLATCPPPENQIYSFLKGVHRRTRLHRYCFVAAVGYLHRMSDRLALARNNWKLLVTAAIMVAQKVSDDESYLNRDFARLLGAAYPIKQLNKMEAAFLVGLNWDCSFTSQEYHAYYRWIRAVAARQVECS